jgi:ferritin
MLTDILQEDIAADDMATVESLREYIEEQSEEYEDWKEEQARPEEDAE